VTVLDHDRLDVTLRDDGELPGERRAINAAIDAWREYSDDPRSVCPHWYPGRALAFDSTTSVDFDSMVADADDALGQTVDAIVDGLPRELAEVLRTHAFRTRWTGAPLLYASRLAVARRAVLAGLLRRGAITVSE
jgi:hypothetical protein